MCSGFGLQSKEKPMPSKIFFEGYESFDGRQLGHHDSEPLHYFPYHGRKRPCAPCRNRSSLDSAVSWLDSSTRMMHVATLRTSIEKGDYDVGIDR